MPINKLCVFPINKYIYKQIYIIVCGISSVFSSFFFSSSSIVRRILALLVFLHLIRILIELNHTSIITMDTTTKKCHSFYMSKDEQHWKWHKHSMITRNSVLISSNIRFDLGVFCSFLTLSNSHRVVWTRHWLLVRSIRYDTIRYDKKFIYKINLK